MSLGIEAERLSHRLMYNTIRINCSKANVRQSTGTGFIFRTKDDVLLLVTNKHVIEDCLSGEITIAEGDENNKPVLGRGIAIQLDNFVSMWSLHPDRNIDLAFMPFKLIVEKCFALNRRPFFTSIESSTIPDDNELKKLTAIEDVLMIGYPNGLWDEVNNIPFFMKGMTATHPAINYKGKPEFAVHMPIYKGSSGSPVFLLSAQFYNRARLYVRGRDYVRLLGIAYKHFKYLAEGKVVAGQEDIKVSSEILLDIGLAIRSTKLTEFESVVEKKMADGEELRL